MKSNLIKFLTVGSLVAGGVVVASSDAEAAAISLGTSPLNSSLSLSVVLDALATPITVDNNRNKVIDGGDFVGIPNTSIITGINFKNNSFTAPFLVPASPNTFAETLLSAVVNIPQLNPVTPSAHNIKIKSFDFNDITKFTLATPAFTPADTAFDPYVINTFNVDSSFGAFVTAELLPTDGAPNDLEIFLNTITVEQRKLLDGAIDSSFSPIVSGSVTFKTSSGSFLGTGSFAGTIPTGLGTLSPGLDAILGNGDDFYTSSGSGSLTFTVTTPVVVPESSPVGALVSFGLVGSAFALRRKAKLS